MKIQCPRCKEIVEMERFATSDEGLRFSCGACGERVFVENRRSLPPEAPSALPSPASGPPPIPGKPGQTVCPKCGHAQDDPVACHRCGLMFSRFDPSLLPPDPPAAVEAWERVLRQPEDDAAHGAFLDACRAAGRLDVAARQYRIWSREPGREESARRMLERVAELGRASLAAPLATGPREPSSIVTAARVLKWLAVLALLGGLTYATVNLLSRSS
jgi:ribosomal protein S27AE